MSEADRHTQGSSSITITFYLSSPWAHLILKVSIILALTACLPNQMSKHHLSQGISLVNDCQAFCLEWYLREALRQGAGSIHSLVLAAPLPCQPLPILPPFCSLLTSPARQPELHSGDRYVYIQSFSALSRNVIYSITSLGSSLFFYSLGDAIQLVRWYT